MGTLTTRLSDFLVINADGKKSYGRFISRDWWWDLAPSLDMNHHRLMLMKYRQWVRDALRRRLSFETGLSRPEPFTGPAIETYIEPPPGFSPCRTILSVTTGSFMPELPSPSMTASTKSHFLRRTSGAPFTNPIQLSTPTPPSQSSEYGDSYHEFLKRHMLTFPRRIIAMGHHYQKPVMVEVMAWNK